MMPETSSGPLATAGSLSVTRKGLEECTGKGCLGLLCRVLSFIVIHVWLAALCAMTVVSSLCMVSKGTVLTSVQFKDYSLQLSPLSGIADVANIVAANTVCSRPPHCYGLVVAYCNSQSELCIARYEDMSTDPVCTKIGESRCISGYLSCKIVDGPLLVINYVDKVCIHSIASAEQFAHPLVFLFAADKANMSCNIFSHSAENVFTRNALALQFVHTTTSSASTTLNSQVEIEWLLLKTDVLQELLLRSERDQCLQNSATMMNAVEGVHSPLDTYSHRLWNFAPHAHIDEDRFSSAICTELLGLFVHVEELNQYYNFAHTTCTRKQIPGSAIERESNVKHVQTLFVAVKKDFELVCYSDGILQYMKQLPFTNTDTTPTIPTMQITNSTSNPLLILCVNQTVLLLDLLHNGRVLKEFSNVGLCVCAPLFHPLSQQLFFIPSKEVDRLGIQGVSSGYLSTDYAALVNSLSSTVVGSGDAALSDWFVYELPQSGGDTSSNSSNSITTKCRSMDPTGRWREDSKFTIDANTYNEVQWQRHIKHRTICSPNMHSTTLANLNETNNTILSKRPADDNIDDYAMKRKKIENENNVVSIGVNISSNSGHVSNINDSATAFATSMGSDLSTVISASNTKVLLQMFNDQLIARRQDLLNNTVEMKYKQACVDYLRSLIVSRASASSSSNSNFNTYYTKPEEENAINNSSATEGGFDSACNTATENSEQTDSWIQQAHQTCTISGTGFTENNTYKSVYLQRLEQMEHIYLAPVFGQNVLEEPLPVEVCTDYCEDSVVQDNVCTHGIVVHSLQHTILPTIQMHYIGVHLTLTNTYTHTLYGVKLSALSLSNPNKSYLTTTSATIDCLLPNTTAIIVAQVAVPHNIFAVNESTDVSFNVALNWRESASHLANNADQNTKPGCMSVYSKAMNGLIKSRSLGRVVGVVHLNMQDLCTPCSMRTPAELLQIEDARWQRYVSHKRQAEMQHSPYIVAIPMAGAGATSANTDTTIQCNIVHSAKQTNPAVPPKVYSYLPSVEVTLTSALLKSQAVDTVVNTDNSAYSINKVIRNLRNVTMRGVRSTELIVLDGEETHCTMYSGGGTVSTLQFPTEAKSRTVTSLQCTGVLSAPRLCTTSSVVSICNALLRLRQLLPTEVHVQVSLPTNQKRYAVWHAAMCLLEEFKLSAVAKRLRRERKHKASFDEVVVEASGAAEDASISALVRRVIAAKLESDHAIAYLFSVLRV